MQTNTDNLKDFSRLLAFEISKRSTFDVDEVGVLIETRFKENFLELIVDYSSHAEQAYQRVKAMASRAPYKSDEWHRLTQKLGVFKSKKLAANRAMFEAKKESKYRRLKAFVEERYGADAISEFIAMLEENKEYGHIK